MRAGEVPREPLIEPEAEGRIMLGDLSKVIATNPDAACARADRRALTRSLDAHE